MWIKEYFTMITPTIQGLQWTYNTDIPKASTKLMAELTTKENKLNLIYQYKVFWVNNDKCNITIIHSLN